MKASHILLFLILLVVVFFFPLRILQFVTLLYIVVVGLSFLYSRIISRSRRPEWIPLENSHCSRIAAIG
ncbi:hypothetical protein ES708_04823 [subsurface metagenome]